MMLFQNAISSEAMMFLAETLESLNGTTWLSLLKC